MNKSHAKYIFGRTAALALGCLLATSAFASTGGPVPVIHNGTVQNIDYLHHAIIVNGRTYAVAPNASYSGVAGFSVLHVGMPIAYTLRAAAGNAGPDNAMPGSPPADAPGRSGPPHANSNPPVITRITWLPGGA